MKALLINPKGELGLMSWRKTCRMTGCSAVHPPLGLLTVAALLPQTWQLRLIDQQIGPVSEADWSWAEIVLLSGMVGTEEGLLDLIAEAKDRGKVVVAGGPYATLVADDCLAAGCDFVVKGEAENTMDQLLASLNGGAKDRVIENGEKADLTRSPIPRFELLDLHQYLMMGVQTSRGCPYDCEFCSVVELCGRRPRYKTPGQVLKELEVLNNLGWRGEVLFADDNFVGNKAQAGAILERLAPWLRDRGEPFEFHTQVSVDLGLDSDMMSRMADANFTTVYVGIESTDQEVLERAHKRQNLRNQPLELVRNMRENGLLVVGHFVIGFDGEESGVGDRIADFIEACDMPLALLHILQALPGTRFWKRLKCEDRLLLNRSGIDTIPPSKPNFVPTRPEHDIIDEHERLWASVYQDSRYLARTYKYLVAMPPKRSSSPLMRGGSLGRRYKYVLALLRLIWRQGVRGSSRRQFWKQLAGMIRENPSRTPPYLATCIVGETMFELRDLLLRYRKDAQDQGHCPAQG